MSEDLKNFMIFKLEQHCRLNGIEETKEAMAKAMKENLTAWVSEAVQAGVNA